MVGHSAPQRRLQWATAPVTAPAQRPTAGHSGRSQWATEPTTGGAFLRDYQIGKTSTFGLLYIVTRYTGYLRQTDIGLPARTAGCYRASGTPLQATGLGWVGIG